MRSLGFGDEMDKVEKGLCPFCDKPVKEEDFTDRLSLADFKITGMCQKCQNETYE